MSRLKLPYVPADQRDTYVGDAREVTFDIENTKLVIHDGATAGGLVVGPTPLIPQPVNQSPADTTSGTTLTPTLQASDYYSLYGVPMAAAQWQVSTVSDFATTEVDDEVAGTATSYTPASNLSTLTTYYWRVRYKDDNGEYSAWSEATSFATADIFIDTPSITSPADNATDIPEQPVIESSAFAVVNGSDTHVASQWRVTRVSDGTVVHDSGDETSNLESYTIPAGVLDEGAVDYTVEVRHKGSTYGYSAWSPVVTFTTASAFFDPAIGDPVQGGYFSGYITSDIDGQTYALIASDGNGDSVQTGAGTFQWRTSQTALSQAQTLSDGRSVMDHILANETLSDFPAFEWIQNTLNSGSGLNGYTDWYLPARDELELVYRHFKPTTEDNNDGTRTTSGFGGDGATHGTNNSSDPNGSGYTVSDPSRTSIASFQQGNSDALEGSGHWSSTEKDASLSWLQFFDDGSQFSLNKDDSDSVRAVRRIAL